MRVTTNLCVVSLLCCGCREIHFRPWNVPFSAARVDGAYIECHVEKAQNEDRCTVYKENTGEILADGFWGSGYPPIGVKDSDLRYTAYKHDTLGAYIFLKDARVLSLKEASERDPTNRLIHDRLESLASSGRQSPLDCGETAINNPDSRISECTQTAFDAGKTFFVRYFLPGVIRVYSYGLADDGDGNVYEVIYDSRGLLTFDLGKNENIYDNNHIRVTTCLKPVTLAKTAEGMLACVVPIDEAASAIAAARKPIETSVCAILENPSAFNNKIVSVHGHFSGNFEYSELSGDGCSGSIWFAYGNGGGPPSLVAHVSGSAEPGARDIDGRRILPVTVKLIQNEKLARFEKLAILMAKLDAQPQGTDPTRSISHQVTATFLGRIDAVSPDIHSFHLKRKPTDRADFLGFGQMGLFDAQFVLEAVEDEAVLEKQPPDVHPQ